MNKIDPRWADVTSLFSNQLRDFEKMSGPNDGSRTLIERVMSRKVLTALDDWRRAKHGGLLIGALGYGHYAKPRFCDKIEMLVPDDFALPGSSLFVLIRPGEAFSPTTLTSVEFRTPATLGLSPVTVERIRASTVISDGVEVAGPAGLIAILLGDRRAQASADIVGLLRLGDVDLAGYDLPEDHLARLSPLRADADDETRRAAAWVARTGEPW